MSLAASSVPQAVAPLKLGGVDDRMQPPPPGATQMFA